MEKNLFEIAARNKYRFPYHGTITTEDLYDLSVENLDGIYKKLNAEIRKTEEDSLLETDSAENTELKNKVEIIKSIVNYKLKMAEKTRKAFETHQKKQRIMSIIYDKKNEELRNKSAEELEQLLESLDDNGEE